MDILRQPCEIISSMVTTGALGRCYNKALHLSLIMDPRIINATAEKQSGKKTHPENQPELRRHRLKH